MEFLVHSILLLLIFSTFEIDCQLNPEGQPDELALVQQLENSQPQSDYPYPVPYAYPPWPLYQHAGIPPPPVPYFGGPPQYPYAPGLYPWNPPQLPYQQGMVPAQSFQMPQIQPPQELINLGSQSPSTPPCATLLSTSNCILRVPDDGLHKDIKERSFVLVAGLIKDQCSLTVQDCSGSYFTTSYYLFTPGGQCTTASSVCCECNGCARGNFQLYENSCAIMFESVKCSTCSGFRLEVADGDSVNVMNPVVDDKVSSIYVLPECDLTVYTRSDFQGDAAIAQGSFDELPYEWNDEISAYKCSCPRKSSPVTTSPSPTQGTLYPIETTMKSTQASTSASMTSTPKPTTVSSISPSTIMRMTTEPPVTIPVATSTTTKPEIITTPEPLLTTTPEIITTPEPPLTTTPESVVPTSSEPAIITTPELGLITTTKSVVTTTEAESITTPKLGLITTPEQASTPQLGGTTIETGIPYY